jgi:hypothetical protein
MTTDQMRCRLAEAYPGPKWRLKCMQMPDRQVIAIFKSVNNRPRSKLNSKKPKKEPGIKKAIQLTIFDLPEFKEGVT